MWTSSSSSPSPSNNGNNTNNNHLTIVSSNTSNNNNSKTMEEVWRDITFASDQYLHSNPPPTTRGMILQDFFKGPSVPPAPILSPSPAPPPTMLNLNSTADGHLDDSVLMLPHIHHHLHGHHMDMISPPNPLSEAFDMNGGAKKKFPESDWNSEDRRQKRMIKNRESAARSRARKQAYTNELELEVAHLLEENARLKKQQQQLYLAAAAQQQKKTSLHRTLTAPF